MDKKEFEQFLHRQIPVTKAMEFSVLEFTASRVRISAKLEPNRNHHLTAFGGSISCLMTVTGWALVYANIKEIDPNAHIVIWKSNIRYLKPLKKDFTAECVLTNEADKINLFKMYNKNHKGKLSVKVHCCEDGFLAAEFEGQYVAFNND